MRCTQLFGLSPAADTLIDEGTVPLYVEEGERIFPDGRREPFTRNVSGPAVQQEEIEGEFYFGMFPEDEKYPFHRYRFPDGRVWREAIQREYWSSGPCIYLALQDETGQWVEESLWPESEMTG